MHPLLPGPASPPPGSLPGYHSLSTPCPGRALGPAEGGVLAPGAAAPKDKTCCFPPGPAAEAAVPARTLRALVHDGHRCRADGTSRSRGRSADARLQQGRCAALHYRTRPRFRRSRAKPQPPLASRGPVPCG